MTVADGAHVSDGWSKYPPWRTLNNISLDRCRKIQTGYLIYGANRCFNCLLRFSHDCLIDLLLYRCLSLNTEHRSRSKSKAFISETSLLLARKILESSWKMFVSFCPSNLTTNNNYSRIFQATQRYSRENEEKSVSRALIFIKKKKKENKTSDSNDCFRVIHPVFLLIYVIVVCRFLFFFLTGTIYQLLHN